MADYPFYDKQPGPERREKLNELYATWQNAISNVIKGDSGWSPLIRAANDFDRVVLELYDWAGGQGSKPTTVGYLGNTGYVSDISLAIDFRGPMGLKGDVATVAVGTVTTTAPGTNATVSNTGTPNSAVFDFEIPKGDTGLKGDAATISVGTVITGGAGTQAVVTNSGTQTAATLDFTIPRGDKGEQGIQGVKGDRGLKGDKGDAGTAATISVGTVTTGAAGTLVQVVNSGTSSNAVFDFTIPKGEDGAGSGDMTKVVYDSVGDGVVNAARVAPWAGITGKPAVISAGATIEAARAVIDAVSTSELGAGLGGKVDKVTGKQLSTEDYTTAEKGKLASVEDGANAYTHPANHPASIITQDENNRFVTDVEKAAWNAKQTLLVSGTNIKTINGESLLGVGDLVVTGSGGGGPTLQGDTTPYVTQTKTYQVTNYNSFSSYAVSASAGTASISGDTITYTAPSTAGIVDLTLTVDGQPTAFAITVQAAGVAKPTNTSPVNGATGIPDSPTLQSSAFAAYGQADTHLASRWTLYQGGTQVHSSGWRTDALTSYTVPAGVMAVSTAYTWTVEHRGATLGDSVPSVATVFTTAAEFDNYIPTPNPTPASFGAPFEGGFYYALSWEALSAYKSTTFVTCSQSKTLSTGTHAFTVNVNMSSTPVVYAGQTLEVRSRANPNNKFIGTVTNAIGNVITLNVTSVSGSGTFSDWSFMSRYRLIAAPKASGENAGVALKNANTALPTACQTLTEGWAATMAMFTADTAAVYPAAHWARNLVINGFDDFFIPARDQLEPSWRNLKPVTNNNYVSADRPTGASFSYANNGSYGDTANTHGTNNNSSPSGAAYTATVPGQTAATAFRSGGTEAFEFGSVYYWSSSEYSASIAWCQSWYSSYPGYQYNVGKTNTFRVRAIRRSII